MHDTAPDVNLIVGFECDSDFRSMTRANGKKQAFIVAIDGPAASGKSTTARLVAEALGYTYIDSGAMYRAATDALLRRGIDLHDAPAVSDAVHDLSISIMGSDRDSIRVFVDNEDVTDRLRDEQVTRWVSLVSSYPDVRRVLVREQRRLADDGGVVMDGRDIGTVVFPNADVKVFMIADLDARAERRYEDLHMAGSSLSVEEVGQELKRRDRLDSSRDASPLRKADDAVEIDTSSLSIEQQVELVLKLVRARQSEGNEVES